MHAYIHIYRFMLVCLHPSIHLYIHTHYIHTYINNVYFHPSIHTYIHSYVTVYIHTGIQTYECLPTYINAHTYRYIIHNHACFPRYKLMYISVKEQNVRCQLLVPYPADNSRLSLCSGAVTTRH